MNKSFVSNLFLVIGINVLVKPFYIFAIDRSVQNLVGASDYGLYFALFNFVYLFQILNDFGIQNFNHSVFSKYDFLIPKYLPKILGTKLILSIIFSLTTLVAAVVVGFGHLIWPLVILILLNQILASLLMYLRTTFSALGHYRIDSLLSVSDKLLMIIGMGFIILWRPWGDVTILQFVLCQTLSFGLAIVVALLTLLQIGTLAGTKVQVDKAFALSLLRRSFQYALVLFLMTLYTRTDGVMIERLLPNGSEQAGIYAASYRILDAFAMVGLLFAGLLLPNYAKLINRGLSVAALTKLSTNLLLTFALTIVSISVVYHQDIIHILYHDATDYWGSVYQILFISYLGISLSYIYGTLLTAHESIKMMNRILIAGVLLNLVLNFFFIKAWQAWGAALATVITQSLTAISLTVLAHRRLSISLAIGHWLAILAFAGVVYAVALWSFSWSLPLLVSWVIVGLVGLVAGGLFGLVDPGKLRSLSDLSE